MINKIIATLFSQQKKLNSRDSTKEYKKIILIIPKFLINIQLKISKTSNLIRLCIKYNFSLQILNSRNYKLF